MIKSTKPLSPGSLKCLTYVRVLHSHAQRAARSRVGRQNVDVCAPLAYARLSEQILKRVLGLAGEEEDALRTVTEVLNQPFFFNVQLRQHSSKKVSSCYHSNLAVECVRACAHACPLTLLVLPVALDADRLQGAGHAQGSSPDVHHRQG
jgi:hypothetical protein